MPAPMLRRAPDAAQRAALAERCAAEPGPYQGRCSVRSRFCEAALKKRCIAPGTQGLRSPDAAQRVALAERCAAEPGPYQGRRSVRSRFCEAALKKRCIAPGTQGLRAPDAAQRAALAERCAAEPGPYQGRCSVRSRFCEAALKKRCIAPGTQGLRAPDAAQRAALAERCAAEPGPYRTPAFGTVPVLRGSASQELRAASRPGHGSPILAVDRLDVVADFLGVLLEALHGGFVLAPRRGAVVAGRCGGASITAGGGGLAVREAAFVVELPLALEIREIFLVGGVVPGVDGGDGMLLQPVAHQSPFAPRQLAHPRIVRVPFRRDARAQPLALFRDQR